MIDTFADFIINQCIQPKLQLYFVDANIFLKLKTVYPNEIILNSTLLVVLDFVWRKGHFLLAFLAMFFPYPQTNCFP